MHAASPQINLVIAWLWVVLGFASGLWMGLNFHREDWLGGYGSFRRRLYRLAHISFFGLAAANLMFYFTAHFLLAPSGAMSLASLSFVVGALSMPACCIITAHAARLRPLFAIPVSSLLMAAVLTLWEVVKL